MFRRCLFVLICTWVCATDAHGDVTSTFEYVEWQSMVDGYSTIDFVGFPAGTPITTQYADAGVTITGPAFIFPSTSMVNDGWGLHGPNGIHLFFDEPQSWLAVHHAGNALFRLFSRGELVGISDFDPIGGVGSFLGVISTTPFDEVVITKPADLGTHIVIDDLHWGAPVPAPGAAMALALAVLPVWHRKRV